jgi:hypothetical protein
MNTYLFTIQEKQVKYIIICLLVLFFIFINQNNLFGQKSEFYEELSSSIDEGKKASEYAEYSMYYIKKCFEQNNISDIHSYAKKAKYEIDDANSKVSLAKSDASDATDLASDLKCDDAEDQSYDAESKFSSAISSFDDAYSYIRKSENTNVSNEAYEYLRKAKNSIIDGLDYIKSALNYLDYSLDEMKNCN